MKMDMCMSVCRQADVKHMSKELRSSGLRMCLRTTGERKEKKC